MTNLQNRLYYGPLKIAGSDADLTSSRRFVYVRLVSWSHAHVQQAFKVSREVYLYRAGRSSNPTGEWARVINEIAAPTSRSGYGASAFLGRPSANAPASLTAGAVAGGRPFVYWHSAIRQRKHLV
ncbi:MAG: hypothetical protein ACE5F6_11895 [Anaerolineae bacterium]